MGATIPRWACGAAATALLVAAAGCGGEVRSADNSGASRTVDKRGGVETLVQVDPAGDINAFGTVPRVPKRDALDLRRVTLKRDSRFLRVTMRTAAKPRGSMTHTFVVLPGQGVRQMTLRVDWDYPRAPVGHLSGPGLRSQAFKVTAKGKAVTARLPLNSFTGARVFRWQAWTALAGKEGKITDTVPNRYANYGLFPRNAAEAAG
jgi:hypothetical protein